MTALQVHDVLDLPREEAVARLLHARNARALRPIVVLVLTAAVVNLIRGIGQSRWLFASASAASLVACVAALYLLRPARVERGTREWLLPFVAGHLALWMLFATTPDGLIPAGFVFGPILLAVLSLRPAERAVLCATVLLISGWQLYRFAGAENKPDESLGMGIGMAVVNLIAATSGQTLTRRRRAGLIEAWTREASRERERSRMREEIEDARQIQLAMLPKSPPRLEWLELAAISLPASEVGGDYFDFLQRDPDRLTMVVGDVAGHGVASGLMLAGVRSCLHLLRDELAEPETVVERLNLVVRDFGVRRLLMTLLLAEFDRARCSARVVSAGHPLAQRWEAATRRVVAVGETALPLGTHLPPRFRRAEAPLAVGDVWLLASDGLLEARGTRGEFYGEERAVRRLEDAAGRGGGAQEILEALLGDLARFKGDSEQEDDLTLLVARVLRAG
ncbi:MAG: PP2C family protein-serine/threonine phosphatase [Thermoanaerobaculia bacterium]